VLADVIRDALEVCAVPAPTGAEQQRAVTVAGRLAAVGLAPWIDAAGNVLARVGAPDADAVVVAAHLDTVFAATTPLAPRRDGNRLFGPGIGDNAVAVAALIELGRSLQATRRDPPVAVLLAATVGEEGLGDLRGIRAVLDEHTACAVIAVEGHGIDSVVTRGVASARFVVTITGPGGHSWRDRDRPSALHALFDAARRVIDAAGPVAVNIGVARGGTSVNTVAAEAQMEIDLRSLDEQSLEAAVLRIRDALATAPAGLGIVVRAAGRRPGGGLRPGDPLLTALQRARADAGLPAAIEDAASTDANAAFAAEIPALAIGLTRGGGTHRTDEWIDLAPLARGVETLLRLVHRRAGLKTPRGVT
jgi:tripeptide aminopeptidase